MTKRQKVFSVLGQFLKNVFTRNIPLKIIALVFALLLWGYVLSEVKPKYVKRVYDVEITRRNEDVLKEKGWVLADPEPLTTDVNVEAGIDKHSMLDTSNVKCYIDLERIPITDQDPDRKTATLNVITTIPDYAALKSVATEQVEVTIERIWTGKAMTATVRTENSLPAIIKTGDTLPEYFACIAPETVTIPPLTGLKSEIDQISRAEVEIDLSAFENVDLSDVPGIYSLTVPVTFYNAGGEPIENASTRDITVTVENVEIRRYKEVPIELNTVIAESLDQEIYECDCAIAEGADRTFRIYGDGEELAKITSVKSEKIIPNLVEGEETLNVGVVVPATVKTDQKRIVPVTVTMKKRMGDPVTIEVPITYSGLRDSMILKEKQESIQVRVSGLADAMKAFDESRITASADLAHCGSGEQSLPIAIRFDSTDLYLADYVVEETEEGEEPLIRITFKNRDDMTYVIELPQKTVKVVLEAKPVEPTGD